MVSATNVVGTSADSSQASATPTAPVVVPAAPGGLTAAAGNNQVGLTWNAVSGATTYNIRRGTAAGGPYTTIATGLTVFTYLDSTAVNSTAYFYVATASNSFGSSANSAEVTATPAVPVVAPAAPTNVAAAGSNGSVSISWDFVPNAASYTIQRATTTGGPYTNVATGVTALTYADATVTNGTTYFYVVLAVNAAGTSAASNEASATPTAPPPAPTAPTGVTASSSNTPSVTVSWATVAGATSYTVKRGTASGGPYSTTVASGIATLTTTDLAVAANSTYFYIVIAANGSGPSPDSAEVTATTPPDAPTGLTLTNGNGEVQLVWLAVPGATSYTVRRAAVSGGPYSTVVGTGLTSPVVSDTTVTNGSVYFYIVYAFGPGGLSQKSAQVTGSPSGALPLAPTGLTATASTTPDVTIGWTAVAGATSYNIVRSSTSQTGGYSSLVTGVSGVSYTDATVVNNNTYWYTVQAVNASGAGAFGGPPPSALVPTVAPSLPTLSTTAAPDVTISWTAVAGGVTYRVKRASVTGGPYTTVGTVSAPTVTYTDTSVANGSTYYYIVTSDNGGIESAASLENSILTYPAMPTGLGAVADNTPQVTASWTAVTGATTYTVYRGTTSGGPYVLTVGSVAAPTVNIVDAAAANNTTYYYVVEATNGAGTSAVSAEAAATLPTVAPTGLAASSTNTPSMNLTWTAATGATGYTIKRGTVTGVHGTTVATGQTGVSYSDLTTAFNTTYFYVVIAENAGGNSQNSNEATATTPPPSPTGLGVVTSATPQADLSWTAAAGATGYNVYRSLINGGPYSLITSLATLAYSDTTVTTGVTYYYVVAATTAAGESANSTQVTAALPTAAPTGEAANVTNDPSIQVSWNAVVGASSYNLKRATVSGGPYTTVDSNITSLDSTDSSVAGNTTYYYVVTAVNGAGESSPSGEVSGTTPPDVPGGVSPTTDNTLVVNLTWAASAGATSYSVSRGVSSSGPFALLGSPATNAYTDNTASGGQNYYYVVSATGPGGTSRDSSPAGLNMYPGQPTGLNATAGNGQITLNWTGTAGATSYRIYRGLSTGAEVFYATSGSLTPTFVDTVVTNSTPYFYTITANNLAGESIASSEVTTTPNGALPDVVTGLFATAGNASANLSWAAAAGATTYNVYRSTTSGGGYTMVATGVGTTSFADSPLTNGTTYYYVVSGVNVSGEGTLSGEADCQPAGVPSPPATVSALAADGSVSLNWSTVSGSVMYNIYRGTTTGGPYSLVIGPVGGITATDGTTTNGTTYFYVVTAVSVGGESANSTEASATPNPGPSVISSNPANFGTNVSPGTHFVVDFSLPMNTTTAAAATSISPPLPYPLQMFWSNGNQKMTVVFDTQAPAGVHGNDILADNTTYTITISTAATSSGGTPMPSAFSAQFTTQTDNTVPGIVSYTPDITTTSIPSATTQIDILFDEDMDTTRGGARLKLSEENEVQANIGSPAPEMSVAWLGDNRTLRVTITGGTLKDATIYQLQTQDCTDLANNYFNQNDGQIMTTTGNGSDSTPPTITGTYPLNGATGVSRDTGFVIGFSEAMSPDVLTHITVTGAGGLTFESALNAQPNVALIGPRTGWPASTVITVTLDTGATDSSGNALAAPYVFSFTTAAGSGNAPALSPVYSTIYNGIDHIEPQIMTQDSRLFTLRFKDSVTDARMAMNGQSLTAADYSLVEKSTGLPLKGYELFWDNSRGLGLSLRGGRSITPVNYNTTYTLTLNTSIQNTQGIGLAAPLALDFTTRINDSNPGRPRMDAPESQYITVQGPPDSHMVELRMSASNSGPNPLTVKVDFQDLVDVGFAQSVTNSSNYYDVQYKSSGDEPTLPITGWHQMMYTVTDTGPTYTQTVLDDGYFFDTTNFPTLLGPGTIAGSTPTYSWSSAAASGADGMFLSVTNVATGDSVLAVLPDLSGTAFTQPSDQPLPSGTYSVVLMLVKFPATGINGGNLPGQALTNALTFTVP